MKRPTTWYSIPGKPPALSSHAALHSAYVEISSAAAVAAGSAPQSLTQASS
tara:strand:+ start:446 stop:598 length:153 start_codon:yes stop_codon:yes gene_type:complete